MDRYDRYRTCPKCGESRTEDVYAGEMGFNRIKRLCTHCTHAWEETPHDYDELQEQLDMTEVSIRWDRLQGLEPHEALNAHLSYLKQEMQERENGRA